MWSNLKLYKNWSKDSKFNLIQEMICWSKEILKSIGSTSKIQLWLSPLKDWRKKLTTKLWMCTSRLLKKWINNLSSTTLPRTVINRWMSCSVISRDKLNRVTRVIKRAFSAISMILNLKCKNMINGSNKLDWILIKTKTKTFLLRQTLLSTNWKRNLKLSMAITFWRRKTWTHFNKC
jgi:hypothetical protein